MNPSRREFLKTSIAAVLGFPAILRAANPNSNLHVAAVGCSGKGFSDIKEIGSHPRVKYTGFCDVDTSRFEKADQLYSDVPHFQDFREMFARLGDRFDAVQVSTPDHMHAFIALEAMRHGKHVFCQKPLTQTVWEARQMRLEAARAKVATQMGNQIHSASEYRTAVRLLRNGVIGRILAVHSWQTKKGNAYTSLTGLPAPGPVPESLNWEWWLGVAPMRDYAPDVYHPTKWRDWQDFGGGTLGDFGCHILDPVFTALELTAPISVRAENDGLNPQTWPVAETVSYVFPGNAFTSETLLPVTWYDGGRMPDGSLARMPTDAKLPGGGSLLIGEEGVMVLPHVGMPQLYPVDKFSTYEIEKVPASSHYHAWVDAALNGTQTTDNFAYAGPLTESVLLGNVATRMPGKLIEWQADGMRIPNLPEAERLLGREYRAGWTIAAVQEHAEGK